MNDFIFNKIQLLLRLNQKLVFTILLLLVSIVAFSQEGSTIYVSDEPFNPKSTGNLSLAFDNLNFFKNNEYKSNYVTGYTLTGTWIRPKLLFYPDKKLRFEVGGQILKYTGRDEYKLYPWFAVVYKPAKNLSFRMGNLNSDQNHGLSEPLMDPEHFITDQPEAGIQAKFKNHRLNADLWIDWQKMIFQGDPFKERFVFGIVSDLTLFETENLTISLPISFNGYHEGGEIDTAPGLAQTHIAVSEGIKVNNKFEGPFFRSWYFESSIYQSTYPEGETALPSKNGSAFHLRSGVTSGCGTLVAGYWHSNRFFAPLGMPLYQNAALNQPKTIDQNSLCTVSYIYDHKIFNQSKFGFVFNMFYNTSTQKISNNAALYLMVNFSVLFRKTTI